MIFKVYINQVALFKYPILFKYLPSIYKNFKTVFLTAKYGFYPSSVYVIYGRPE